MKAGLGWDGVFNSPFTILKSPIYHGNKDAYYPNLPVEFPPGFDYKGRKVVAVGPENVTAEETE